MVHLKNIQEIEAMRASATLVSKTLAEVAGHIRPGVTTAALDAVAEAYIAGNNGKPAFKGYRVGPRSFPATLCISVNEEVVHGIPGDYALQEGDLISVDCGVRLNGYFGDSAYTFAVGEVPAEKLQLCRVTYDSLIKAIEVSTVGHRIGDISSAVQTHCESHGYGVVRDLVGHGIGRQLHEDPQVPNYGRRGTGRKLKEGMTICIEPMINAGTYEVTTRPDGWTIVTDDASPSAHYEHMVVVQRGEADVLSTFSYIEAVVEAPYTIEFTNG
ncbi:MAG: type I methionyl aminopeptidase [Rhodothermales bacterium]